MNLHEYLLKDVVTACRRHAATHQIAKDRRLIGSQQLAEGLPVTATVTRQPVALVEVDDRFHGLGFEAHRHGSPGIQVRVVHRRREKVSAPVGVGRRFLGRRPRGYPFMATANGAGGRRG